MRWNGQTSYSNCQSKFEYSLCLLQSICQWSICPFLISFANVQCLKKEFRLSFWMFWCLSVLTLPSWLTPWLTIQNDSFGHEFLPASIYSLVPFQRFFRKFPKKHQVFIEFGGVRTLFLPFFLPCCQLLSWLCEGCPCLREFSLSSESVAPSWSLAF